MDARFLAHPAPATVLDFGCGTGTFACLLIDRGVGVVGVDPAAASIEVARRKPGADRVRWYVGDATELPSFRHPLAAAYVLGREKGSLDGQIISIFLNLGALKQPLWQKLLRPVSSLLPSPERIYRASDKRRQSARLPRPG